MDGEAGQTRRRSVAPTVVACYLVLTGLFCLFMSYCVIGSVLRVGSAHPNSGDLGSLVAIGFLGGLQIVLGIALWFRYRWARTAAILLFGLVLLSIAWQALSKLGYLPTFRSLTSGSAAPLGTTERSVSWWALGERAFWNFGCIYLLMAEGVSRDFD